MKMNARMILVVLVGVVAVSILGFGVVHLGKGGLDGAYDLTEEELALRKKQMNEHLRRPDHAARQPPIRNGAELLDLGVVPENADHPCGTCGTCAHRRVVHWAALLIEVRDFRHGTRGAFTSMARFMTALRDPAREISLLDGTFYICYGYAPPAPPSSSATHHCETNYRTHVDELWKLLGEPTPSSPVKITVSVRDKCEIDPDSLLRRAEWREGNWDYMWSRLSTDRNEWAWCECGAPSTGPNGTKGNPVTGPESPPPGASGTPPPDVPPKDK
ncbi:MAG: hypothetical protein HYY93_11265 [Planctomycetes bacterium]|nr:hypothetical protein [Planctomycetota bacterium]